MGNASRGASSKRNRNDDTWADVPPAAHELLGTGQPKTREALKALFHRSRTSAELLFDEKSTAAANPFYSDDFSKVARAVKARKWEDDQVAELLKHFKTTVSDGTKPDFQAFTRFIDAHDERATAQGIIDCVTVRPPSEIEVIKQLSKQGNQKVVYLGVWKSTNQKIVLKQIRKIGHGLSSALSRESRNHPLSFKTIHPNIIQTHTVRNEHGETFLVERYLKKILSETWRTSGIQEASGLLFDLLSALLYINGQELVHGDIKPDNIGVSETGFVLMDFGSCQKFSDFSRDNSTAGSIRTCPPEVLLNEEVDARKVDVWSLGATIFFGTTGRYPLFRENERIPLPYTAERADYTKELASRISNEWPSYVNFDGVPRPLGTILRSMLERHPKNRPTPKDLVRFAQKELLGYRAIRFQVPETAGIPLTEELETLEIWLRRTPGINKFSAHRRQKILLRLIDTLPDIPDGSAEKKRVEDLISLLGMD